MNTTPNPFARYVTDAAVEAAARAANQQFYDGLYSSPASVDNAMRSALLAALAIVGPEIRREALEEAAKVADPVPRGWPSSGREPGAWQLRRMHIAAAIRALGEEG